MVWPIVGYCVMLGRSVVPDGNAVSFPLVVHHEFGFFHPVEQKAQYTDRFMAIDAFDVSGKVAVDKNTFTVGVRVDAYHRVNHRFEGLDGCN